MSKYGRHDDGSTVGLDPEILWASLVYLSSILHDNIHSNPHPVLPGLCNSTQTERACMIGLISLSSIMQTLCQSGEFP